MRSSPQPPPPQSPTPVRATGLRGFSTTVRGVLCPPAPTGSDMFYQTTLQVPGGEPQDNAFGYIGDSGLAYVGTAGLQPHDYQGAFTATFTCLAFERSAPSDDPGRVVKEFDPITMVITGPQPQMGISTRRPVAGQSVRFTDGGGCGSDPATRELFLQFSGGWPQERFITGTYPVTTEGRWGPIDVRIPDDWPTGPGSVELRCQDPWHINRWPHSFFETVYAPVGVEVVP